MNKTIVILAVAAFSAAGAYADEGAEAPMVLTLADAINRTLEVDEGLKSAHEDVSSADHAIKEARAAFIPTLTGDVTAYDIIGMPTLTIPAGSFGPGFPPQDITMSTGGDKNLSAGVTLNYMPYQGGREYTGYRLAKRGLDLSRESLRQSRGDTILGVVKAYYGVVFAEEAVRVANTSVAVATNHVTATEDRYDAGLVSEYDVLRARVQLTNLETARRQAEDGRAAASRYLLSLLDLPPGTALALTNRLTYEPRKYALEESLATAEERRPDLRQVKYARSLAEEGVKMARGADNVNVIFNANFKYYATDYNLNFADDWSDQTTLTLMVQWPFFDGFATRARVGRARASLYKTEFAMIRAAEAVDMDVRASYDNLLTYEANVDAQKDNVDLARRGLEIAEARYNAGLMSNLEVLDAQAAVTQAELGYYQALYSYEVAKFDMERARGEIDEYPNEQ